MHCDLVEGGAPELGLALKCPSVSPAGRLQQPAPLIALVRRIGSSPRDQEVDIPFARTHVERVRSGGRLSDAADRDRNFVVGLWRPGGAAIGGLPHTATGGGHIHGAWR